MLLYLMIGVANYLFRGASARSFHHKSTLFPCVGLSALNANNAWRLYIPCSPTTLCHGYSLPELIIILMDSWQFSVKSLFPSFTITINFFFFNILVCDNLSLFLVMLKLLQFGLWEPLEASSCILLACSIIPWWLLWFWAQDIWAQGILGLPCSILAWVLKLTISSKSPVSF